MKQKDEQKPEETRDAEFEIQEIDLDEVEDVTGGTFAIGSCGACSCSPPGGEG